MSYCPKCGKNLGDQEKFCSQCGWQVPFAITPFYLKPWVIGSSCCVLVILVIFGMYAYFKEPSPSAKEIKPSNSQAAMQTAPANTDPKMLSDIGEFEAYLQKKDLFDQQIAGFASQMNAGFPGTTQMTLMAVDIRNCMKEIQATRDGLLRKSFVRELNAYKAEIEDLYNLEYQRANALVNGLDAMSQNSSPDIFYQQGGNAFDAFKSKSDNFTIRYQQWVAHYR